MLLSILICSIHRRAAMLQRLLTILDKQSTPQIEVLVETDGENIPVGAKRNILLDKSRGDYIAFIDDDDIVSDQYVPRILDALAKKTDAVGFKVNRYIDGKLCGSAIHSLRFNCFSDRQHGGAMEFERTPNHLNPIRRDLALATRFKEISFGEDRDYAARIYPLLKTEIFIDEFLYDYLLLSRHPAFITEA